MNKKTIKELILEEYSFVKSSLKYIPKGGELLNYQGCDLMFLDYKRENQDSQWDIKEKIVHLVKIDNFEELTGTYEATYFLVSDEDHSEKTLRIIPEGFSFGNPEETNEMKRFVPMSLHFTLIEREILFGRVKKLFNTKDTLSFNALSTLQKSNQEETLHYRNNIVLAINTKESGLSIIRIHKITTIREDGKFWIFGVRDELDNYIPLKMSKNQNEIQYLYINGEFIGNWKILDLGRQ